MLPNNRPNLHCLCLILMLVTACNLGLTPSKQRFEKDCHVTIPVNSQVVKDEYHDMGADYVIDYQLKLTSSEMRSFATSIRHSDYYNDTVRIKHGLDDTILKGPSGDRGVWRKSVSGFTFYKREHRTEFTMAVDTITNTIIATEGYGG